jgi:Glycosyl hydrolase family 12
MPAQPAKRKPAKPARRKLVRAVKRKPAKPAKTVRHKHVNAAKRKPAKHAKPRKLAKRGKKSAASRASDAFLLCRHDASVRVHGHGRTYLVNNNNFMDLAECLSGSAHAPAFRVARSRATSTGPDSDAFPDIYTGCSWGRCSPGAKLPARVSDLGDPATTWDTTENAGGLWAATYDMWFDQRPIRTGQANAEMMIWLNVRGLYNPAGMGWPVVRIDGALWYVLTWITGNGHQQWRYVQFRKYTPRWNVTGLSLKPFYQYMENQGWITPSWYALNVEAGFEIWNGGTGLSTTAFSET